MKSNGSLSLVYKAKKVFFHLAWRAVAFTGKRECPVCGHRLREFVPAGIKPRPNARCIWCGSLERHRLIWLFFQRHTNLLDSYPKRMLHFAPEPAFKGTLSKALGMGYVTADLYSDALIRADITRIPCPANTFEVVFASHVLEHVMDDRQAIRELARVLKPEGWALIVVPVAGEKTLEDFSVTDPAERLRLFGQTDHVRICGNDYAERLESNGFHVREYGVHDIATTSEQARFGLQPRTLYYCTRNS